MGVGVEILGNDIKVGADRHGGHIDGGLRPHGIDRENQHHTHPHGDGVDDQLGQDHVADLAEAAGNGPSGQRRAQREQGAGPSRPAQQFGEGVDRYGQAPSQGRDNNAEAAAEHERVEDHGPRQVAGIPHPAVAGLAVGLQQGEGQRNDDDEVDEQAQGHRHPGGVPHQRHD